MRTWWENVGGGADQRGATAVEWVMVAALVMAVLVLAATLGPALIGNVA